jgi:hypothetical protein
MLIPTALTYLAKKGDHTTLQSFVSAMPASDVKTIYQLDLNYRANNAGIKNLTVTDSTILDSLARNSATASTYAKGIMHFVYGKTYPLPLPKYTANALRKAPKPIYYDVILPDQLISIQPNPASNIVNIINYDTKAVKLQIDIRDVAGKIIMQKTMDEYKTITALDISSIQAGTYILTITNNNKSLFNEKLVIIK